MLGDLLKFFQSLKELRTEVLLYIIGAIFWFFGLFEITQNSINLRNVNNPAPLILGAIFLILGLLFSFGFKKQQSTQKKIIFYSPTIKENPFYHELLDHIIEIAARKNIQVIAQKGITTTPYYHAVDDFYDVLSKFSNSDYKNTVIIMIPPSPQSYDRIFALDSEMKINLITLDMEVDQFYENSLKCNFLKKVITVDNEKGCQLAADTVITYCKSQGIKDINVITCEGEFHDRGKYFRDYLREAEVKSKININFINELEKRSFSRATIEAYNCVIQSVSENKDIIEHSATFVFCANDNMAIGARVALSNLDLSQNIADIKIISFDASDVIRQFIDLEDRYITWSVDQKYYKYADEAVKYAEMILSEHEIETKVAHINPEIYRK